MSEVIRETKAQRVERLKRELNPWGALSEIRRFGREGLGAVPPEWQTYFRWWGVYSQGDGAGVTGGKGGEGRAAPYFMVRIRIPNGLLVATQLRAIADLADRHARGVADLTVRQNIQLHWVRVEDLPVVLDGLTAVGLTTMGSCGDDTRNITGCPLAGVDADEVVDASPLVHAATAMLNGAAEFYNLPRKYKISITGCRAWCSYPEIQDVGLTALRHPDTGEIGFSLRVGGGLSTDPHLGVRLGAFVPWDHVLVVLKAVTELFRDQEVLRQSREKARLKFLFLTHDWTADGFQAALEQRLGFALPAGVPETPPDDVYRDHVGIHAQKVPGTTYVGAAVLRGRATPARLRAAADLADRHGSGEIRTTIMQNLLIPNVPRAEAADVARALEAAGLPLEASSFRRGTVACTGSEFCKLALTETKGFAAGLVDELERRLPGFEEHVKLHVTGCPNSCGQHWIADIGLEGKKVKVEGQMVDAYYFCVGGGVGKHQAKARPIGYRIPAAEVPGAIERLLHAYRADRRNGENFRQFSARHTNEELRDFLAGERVAAVTRDPSPGRPPHDVDG